MKEMNKYAWRALRRNLCDRYGGCCAYCGVYVGLRGTVDHYVPQAMGGMDDIGNLRWACHGCNQLKGDMSPKDWAMYKPPNRRVESKYEKRVRLLSSIAQRGSSLWWVLVVIAFGAWILEPLLKYHYAARCIEGHQYHGQAQVLDGEGRPVRCESVRPSDRKPGA